MARLRKTEREARGARGQGSSLPVAAHVADRGRRSSTERLVDRVLHWRRWRKAARAQGGALLDLSTLDAAAGEEQLIPSLLAGTSTLRARLGLLERVFTAGGYETAQALVDVLEPEIARAERALRRRALPLFTRVWITTGQLDRAQALWARAGGVLTASHPWRQALRLSAYPHAALQILVARTPYPYPAAVGIQRGAALAQLEAGLRSRPWAQLLNPELDLLLHNAALPEGDPELSALNRYLARQGLPSARKRPGARPFLGSLAFERGSVSHGPLVSVILSARNAEHTIAYAVDSILEQSYAPLELLVADDGSSDATWSLLRERYLGAPNVRLFRSSHNQGTYNVRNQLLAEARGELVTFQDADDLALPLRIAEQVRVSREPGRVGSISEWLRVRPDGSIAFFANGKAARLSIVSFMVTRAALRAVGSYPGAKVGADLDVYRRVLAAHGPGSVGRIPVPLLLGLWGEGSLTRSQLSESLESGYRSPVRRRYSELVFRRDLFGRGSLSDERLLSELRALDNYREASSLIAEPPPAR